MTINRTDFHGNQTEDKKLQVEIIWALFLLTSQTIYLHYCTCINNYACANHNSVIWQYCLRQRKCSKDVFHQQCGLAFKFKQAYTYKYNSSF